MRVDRLLEGAAFLDALQLKENQEFNMNIFVRRMDMDSKERCNTAACALGWMALYGMFDLKPCSTDSSSYTIRHTESDNTGFNAAVEAFGISEIDAEMLFDPCNYSTSNITKEMVARRMRQFANGTSKEEDDAG